MRSFVKGNAAKQADEALKDFDKEHEDESGIDDALNQYDSVRDPASCSVADRYLRTSRSADKHRKRFANR